MLLRHGEGLHSESRREERSEDRRFQVSRPHAHAVALASSKGSAGKTMQLYLRLKRV